MIKEVIVVEGRDDVTAVKGALECDVIQTHGFGYGKRLINQLKDVQKKRGLIIFTDPDYMGKKIRSDISSQIKGVKHAFLPQSKATKKDNIGIENAKAEDIRVAIMNARPDFEEKMDLFNESILMTYGLTGRPDSKAKRELIGDILKIGHGNAKQMLNKLNGFKITVEEFEEAVDSAEKILKK
ncbi:ribonuclease M5 [Peptoniphilus asaccharolyticus]